MLLALLAILALVPAAPSMAAPAASQELTGIFVRDQPVPDLELPTLDGRASLRLGALGGRKAIVLQFASW
jgi:hypothetical protein